ncbi:glycosyltransferase family 4 protein [Sphingobium sp. SCG-1]|uniref:glycosyltransferase family 4 protein n=1 Tax=Sphingobium sp. SCG-1 TaxID=2072936 RepID=UPI001CB9CD15|nr:glycosyltransferase family 4 protein [Sphingobium sp. SCG-1]
MATFTNHCRDALLEQFPDVRIDHYAMDDGRGEIEYPADVHLINDRDARAYARAAQQIEESGAEAIWLQHEFGIFGGAAGDLILHLLARTRLPLVTTFHTILEKPSADERRVMDRLLDRSRDIIVMSEFGREILQRVYNVDDRQISVIPHGVPDRPLIEAEAMKPQFGWAGRKVILTFGLLAPDKGIENMIEAMPAIVERCPEALYVIVGATHPNLIREQGETLRESLVALTHHLGIADNVQWIDNYQEQEELLDRLQAADVYVTPYVNPAQVTSGTLSYAVSMGKAVVSTPYIHATEILDQDHGILVPFRDSAAIADAIIRLLTDDKLRRDYGERAYARGREMLWRELARRVGLLLVQSQGAQPAKLPMRRNHLILEPNLSAVFRMSDGTGMLQHGILSVPDRRHGYCIDDNARALLLMTQVPVMDEELRDQWISTYAAFVQHAWNPDKGRFRNFMSYDRSWCEDEGSEDSSGRAMWALGVTARDAPLEKQREWAARLFNETIEPMQRLASPRAQAFVMLGASAILETEPGHVLAKEVLRDFGRNLLALIAEARRPDWAWFEAVLAYDNPRLSEALLRAGVVLQNADFIECGLTTLEWIWAQQTAPTGHFRAVGSESFGEPYAPPLPFDQQPLEAQAMIDAAEAAFAIDQSGRWLDCAHTAYRWYLGDNDLSLPLATRQDGGCYDGLTPTGVNRNQGAESLLALQLSSCAMNRLSQIGANVAIGATLGDEIIPA